MTADTRAERRAILFFLDLVRAANPRDIGEAVNWDRGREALQQLLARMERKGEIERKGYGLYGATGRHRWLGLSDRFGEAEDRIRTYLLGQPGHRAPTKDIQNLFEKRNWKGRTYMHAYVHKVLKESPWFRHWADGLWALEPFACDPWHLYTR